MNDRLMQLSEMVSRLFDATSDNFTKGEANEFIQTWQKSENVIYDCIDIFNSCQDQYLLFVAIKTVQIHIRYSWDILKLSNSISTIINCFLLLIPKFSEMKVHQDFVLISLCDIMCQIGNIDESFIRSIPVPLVHHFFAFFFEDFTEFFLSNQQKIYLQTNFIPLGFQILSNCESFSIDCLKIIKFLSLGYDSHEYFFPFYKKLIQISSSFNHYIDDLETHEAGKILISIIDNMCKFDYPSFNDFNSFLDFFRKVSINLTSPIIWLSFLEIRSDFFCSINYNESEIGVFKLFIEKLMKEFFRVCSFTNMNDNSNNYVWVDIISLSFYFFLDFDELNENGTSDSKEIIIKYHALFIQMIMKLLDYCFPEDEICSILSNLHCLSGFTYFIQNFDIQDYSYSFFLIVSYNINFLPMSYVNSIVCEIVKSFQTNPKAFSQLMISIIENIFPFIISNVSNFQEQVENQSNNFLLSLFLIKLFDLLQFYPEKSSKALYKVISTNHRSLKIFFEFLTNNYFTGLFTNDCNLHQLNYTYIIPSLLFLLNGEKNEIFTMITNKILEITTNIQNPMLYLFFLKQLIVRLPPLNEDFIFFTNFYKSLSQSIIMTVFPLALNSNSIEISELIFQEIIIIFKILLKKSMIQDYTIFIPWYEELVNRKRMTKECFDFFNFINLFQ